MKPLADWMDSVVSLKVDDRRGRYMEALQDIQPGKCILYEIPFVAVISNQYKHYVCNNCFIFISELNSHNSIICSNCFQVRYCSSQCKNANRYSETFHTDRECRLLPRFTESLRSKLDEDEGLIVRLIIRILCMEQFEDEEDRFSISDLIHHMDQLNSETISRINIIADTLCGIFEETLDRSEIALMISRIRCNFFGLWTRNTNTGGIHWTGAAVYRRCSMLNHDCLPNCAVLQESTLPRRKLSDYYFYGHERPLTFSLRSLRFIPKGTELTISYIGLNVGTDKRRDQLNRHWMFHCDCDRCMSTTDVDEDFLRSVCPNEENCNGGLLIPEQETNEIGERFGYCRVCTERSILVTRS